MHQIQLKSRIELSTNIFKANLYCKLWKPWLAVDSRKLCLLCLTLAPVFPLCYKVFLLFFLQTSSLWILPSIKKVRNRWYNTSALRRNVYLPLLTICTSFSISLYLNAHWGLAVASIKETEQVTKTTSFSDMPVAFDWTSNNRLIVRVNCNKKRNFSKSDGG